jgi:hypothetical protein
VLPPQGMLHPPFAMAIAPFTSYFYRGDQPQVPKNSSFTSDTYNAALLTLVEEKPLRLCAGDPGVLIQVV